MRSSFNVGETLMGSYTNVMEIDTFDFSSMKLNKWQFFFLLFPLAYYIFNPIFAY